MCSGVAEVMLLNEPAGSQAVGVAGDLAVTVDHLGLSTWNIEDPTSPEYVASWVAPRGRVWQSPQGVHLDSRGYAVLFPSMMIFDVRDATDPQPLWAEEHHCGASGTTDGWAGFAVHDSMIAAACGLFNVRLLDFTDPANPVWIDPDWPETSGLNGLVDLTFVGDKLMTLGVWGSFAVFSLEDPFSPELVSEGNIPSGLPSINCTSISSSADRALIAAGKCSGYPEMIAVDLTDPIKPVMANVTETLSWGRPFYTIRFDGHRALLTHYSEGGYRLSEIDLVDVASPEVVFSKLADAFLMDVEDTSIVQVKGGQLSVVSRSAGLPILGASPIRGYADDLTVDGHLGIVDNAQAGLILIDLSEPYEPHVMAEFDPGAYSFARDLAFSGSIAVVTNGEDEASIIDVSDAEHPNVVGSLSLENPMRKVDLEDSHLAVLTGEEYETMSLALVDLSDPEVPAVNSVLALPLQIPYTYWYTCGLEIQGATVFIYSQNWMVSVDISDTTTPVLLDAVEVLNSRFELSGMAVMDDIAILGSIDSAGTHMVDIRNPADLQLLAPVTDLRSVHFSNPYESIVSVDILGGSAVADFFDPSAPDFDTSYEPMRFDEPGAFVDGVLYVADGPFLEVVSLECREPESRFSVSGAGLQIWFANQSRYHVTSNHWDFGDGTTSGERDPVHRFEAPGTYAVRLTVSSPNGNHSVTQLVKLPGPMVVDRVRRAGGRASP